MVEEQIKLLIKQKQISVLYSVLNKEIVSNWSSSKSLIELSIPLLDIKFLKFILSLSPNLEDFDKILFKIIQNKNLFDISKFLIEFTVDNINIRDKKTGKGLLTYFIINNWDLSYLKERDINIQTYCLSLKSPLMYFLSQDFNQNDLDFILSGSDFSLMDLNGNSIFHYMANSKKLQSSPELIKTIIEHAHGQIPYLPNHKSETPLSLIIKSKKYNSFSKFINKSVFYNFRFFPGELNLLSSFIFNKDYKQFNISFARLLEFNLDISEISFLLKELILKDKSKLKWFIRILEKKNILFLPIYLDMYIRYKKELKLSLISKNKGLIVSHEALISSFNIPEFKDTLLTHVFSEKNYSNPLLFDILSFSDLEKTIPEISSVLEKMGPVNIPAIYMFKYQFEYSRNITIGFFDKFIEINNKYDQYAFLFFGLRYLKSINIHLS